MVTTGSVVAWSARPLLQVLCVALLQLRVAAGAGPASAGADPDPARPNVLIILADDIGVGDLTVYNGDSRVPTPNIDALALSSVRFTDFHAATICAPSRYMLLSGRNADRGRYPNGAWKLNQDTAFKAGQDSLANVLGRAGFDTAFFGKWHLGGGAYDCDAETLLSVTCPGIDFMDRNERIPRGAGHLGFQHSFMSPGGIQSPPYAYWDDDRLFVDGALYGRVASYTVPDDVVTLQRNATVSKSGDSLPYWDSTLYAADMMERYIAFLEQHAASRPGDPFYVHYCTEAVHAPHTPPAYFYGDPVAGTTPTAHLDMVAELDLIVAKLLAELHARDVLNNTIVVFVSDNGGLPNSEDSGHDTSYGRRGRKGMVYEGGHLAPAMIRWDLGPVQPGGVLNDLASIMDIFRTVADLAGVSVPAGQATDSLSFKGRLRPATPASEFGAGTGPRWGLVVGKLNDPKDGYTHRCTCADGLSNSQCDKRHYAVRRGPMKAIMCSRNGGWMAGELFDLSADVAETVDLSSRPEYAGVLAMMVRVLESEACDAEPTTAYCHSVRTFWGAELSPAP